MPPQTRSDEATLLKQAQAAAWALNQIGAQNYYNLCQRFIENAYGTSSQFGTAAQAGNALNMQTDPMEADVGDLVFFRPDASNGNAGHVGINIGGGQMVSATNKGITVDNFLTNSYWKNLFVGIGDPPAQWQGRPDSKDLVSGAATMVSQGRAAAGDATAGAWGAAAPYRDKLLAASAKHGVPVNVLAGLLIQESGGDPRAVSRAGAQGVMQFMPDTARGMGIDPWDPAQAIDAGAKYLSQLADMAGGDWSKAVGMYNAGPAGNLNNAETRNHITKVMQFAEGIGGSMMQIPPPGGPFGGPPNMPGGPGGPPPPGGGGDRNRDRRGPEVPQGVQTGVGYLLQYLRDLQQQAGGMLPDVSVTSGQRTPSQQGAPVAPGVPGTEGITGGGRGAPSGSVQISLSDLQEAIGRDGAKGIQDLLFGLVRGASPVGAVVAQTGTGNVMQLPPPSGPGGGPGGGGSRNDPGFERGIAGQESRDQAGPGPTTGPSTPTPKGHPPGWTDPSRYTGTHRAIVEQANDLAQQIADAQETMSRVGPSGGNDYYQAQTNLQTAQAALSRLAPQLEQIEQQTRGEQEGTVLPGSTPYQRNITIIRKKPGTDDYEVVSVPNPNAEENPSITTANISAGASRYGADVSAATSRYGADVAAGSSRYASDVSRENALTGAAAQLGAAGISAQSAANVANIGSATQRVTAALSAAVDQQRSRIDAQIRSGELTATDGYQRWNQWYKTNVEAPLAILEQQRQTELYKVQQHQAITQRASGQAEHERGMAQIGSQMFANATNAYTSALDRSAPVGWGEAYQKNLQGNGYTPMPTNMPVEALEGFATRQVANILKDVSPYAASIASAQGQIGNPGQAMGGDQMTGLQNQATGVASNALANPMVTEPLKLPALPAPINPMDYVGQTSGGMPQVNIPQFSMGGSGYGRG